MHYIRRYASVSATVIRQLNFEDYKFNNKVRMFIITENIFEKFKKKSKLINCKPVFTYFAIVVHTT